MCTAIACRLHNTYFGRTLDYDHGYFEEVTITPRNYRLHFGRMGDMQNHYAIIGTAYVRNDYPLYYDAMNEKGLCMAGLNFVGNAVYRKPITGRDNVAQFELIPWILGQCGSVREAKAILQNLNITDTPFSETLPTAELHWLIADADESIVVESVDEGVRIYQNPVGVLTNNPPFPVQLHRLNDYRRLSPADPQNMWGSLPLSLYSRGMGGLGLPGDLSSASRFVRAAFTKWHACSGENDTDDVGQFFHIMETVSQTRGCCELPNGAQEYTLYTSCCHIKKGVYYYTTYQNRQITAVDMHRERLDDVFLVRYPLKKQPMITRQN